MMNQEILEKAIQAAIDGGFKPWFPLTDEQLPRNESIEIDGDGIYKHVFTNDDDYSELIETSEAIIFNHDFAKALWGEELYYGSRDKYPHSPTAIRTYQYHLQQMVIEEDPIKYLGKNLPK